MTAVVDDASEIQTLRRVPANTWTEHTEEPPVINEYLKNYPLSHFKAMAKHVEKVLDPKLKESGIRFRLSARSKTMKSLREKLMMRYAETGRDYENFAHIKRDIVDLAGVRIILYMPTKEENLKVKQMIQQEWGQDVKAKRHPPRRDPFPEDEDDDDDDDTKRRKYRPRHLGYRAIHYRIPMKDDNGDHWGYLQGDQVEVQVVSALTHAWAEVGHDVLYKSYAFGPPSTEEERTLDALNGLIQSGDLLLEQFQEMVLKRTSLPFTEREDLTLFLRQYWNHDDNEGLERAKFPRGESIYILFKFLTLKGLNSPMALRRTLTKLQYPFEHHVKERLILKSFSPIPLVAADMSVVICVIRDLLSATPYEAPQMGMSSQEMCGIMMSTLTLLEFSLGGAEQAKTYLQKVATSNERMSDAAFNSVNFVLDDIARKPLLEGGRAEGIVDHHLKPAWDWFRTEASDPESFCGFLFSFTEMGCRKPLAPAKQMEQLHITPLSRSSTETGIGDTGPNA